MSIYQNSCPHCGGSGLKPEDVLELSKMPDDEVADMIPCPCVKLHWGRLELALEDSGMQSWDLSDEDIYNEALAFLTGWYVSQVRHFQKNFPVSSGKARVAYYLTQRSKRQDLKL